ncbi:YggS family pyridoxal phosphate-dependent enzyme [Ignavibacteriales bacterium]
MIRKNIEYLRELIARKCLSTGRSVDSVTLIAVSKLFGTDKIRVAMETGQTHFGENYAQEFRDKYAELESEKLIWHYIGTLQTNKVKFVAGNADFIHSVDSLKLLTEIQKQAEKKGVTQKVFLEFKSSFEATKSGSEAEGIFALAEASATMKNIAVSGLMTMAPFVDDITIIRDSFVRTRILRDELIRSGYSSIRELSMGMTGDYNIAIEEGTTFLRIGTAIFGERN